MRRALILLLVTAFLAGCGTPGQTGGQGVAGPAAPVASAPAGSTAAPVAPTETMPVPAGDSRALGRADAPVTITLYSDFECPYCALFVRETMPQLYQQYIKTGVVKLAFRDFPITSSHPSALLAASAGHCAAQQGQFWPMHDRLFATHGESWGGLPSRDRAAIMELAAGVGLDQDAFGRCLDNPATQRAVQDDADEAVRLRVNATPSFFINGQALRGAQSFETFAGLIDQARAGPLVVAAPTAEPTPVPLPQVASDDPRALGRPDAPVQILLYSDFECPFCGKFTRETFGRLKSEYIDTGKVRLIYRDFPLMSIHRSALVAALAGRCAAEQGQFWPMHDRLFATHEEEWGGVPKRDQKVMIEFAAGLNLDTKRFAGCLGNPITEQSVLAEAEEGLALGVEATPTFLINGRLLAGAQPFEVFQQAIEEAAR